MRILLSTCYFCCFTLLLVAQKKEQVLQRRPNIIFILTDDQRFDALGHVGNKLVSTPEMDKLARKGTYFKNAMVTTPICAASRASILTGLYERTHNFNFQTGSIRESYMSHSYPTALKANGYVTGFYGKYGVRYEGLEKQFDHYESYDRNNSYRDRRGYYYKTLGKDTVHLTRYTGQKAIDFINEVKIDQPFCLSLSFSAPHAHDPAKEQYFWQKASDSLLQGEVIPDPELNKREYFEAQPKFVRDGFNRLRWKWRYNTPEKYQHSVKGYYRMISGIDREIAKIRHTLKEKGMDKNTVIILMGDNGYFLGERQLAGKWLLYDNSVRVPLIIYDPREKKQGNSDALALNIDVPATILDLAGTERPETWQGKSLMPIVMGQTNDFERDTVLIEHIWEFEHIPPSEGIRTRDWKYFRYVNNKSIEELYYLKDDPKEIHNLAKETKYAQQLKAFRRKTDDLILKYSDTNSMAPDNLAIEGTQNKTKVTISDPKPEYSWIVPQSAVMQSACQLLAATSEENLSNNIGDVWDSGQMRTNISSEIEHGGQPLKDGTTYYWKVRIWDQDNRLSKYSEGKSFQVQLPINSTAPPRNLLVNKNGEQLSHEIDAYLNQLNRYIAAREYGVSRQLIEYFMEHPSRYTEQFQHMALMLHADYMYTGNTELIEKYYEALRHRTLHELADQNGLITTAKVTQAFMRKLGFKEGRKVLLTDLAERSPQGLPNSLANNDPKDVLAKPAYYTVINTLYYQNMKIMAELAKLLGKTDEALTYEIHALKAKKAINQKMFDTKKGVYVNGIGSEHASFYANVLPLVFGIVPQEHIPNVLKHIKTMDIPHNKYASQYLLDALYQVEGYHDWLHRLILDTTTTKEISGKTPTNVDARNLWGIRPKTPGFGMASIKPQMGDLRYHSIEVPTIKGDIKAEYNYKSPKLQLFKFEVPANMVAEFELDFDPKIELVHNEKKINPTFGSIRLNPGKHEIRLVKSLF